MAVQHETPIPSPPRRAGSGHSGFGCLHFSLTFSKRHSIPFKQQPHRSSEQKIRLRRPSSIQMIWFSILVLCLCLTQATGAPCLTRSCLCSKPPNQAGVAVVQPWRMAYRHLSMLT
jgi:hypothetical protein